MTHSVLPGGTPPAGRFALTAALCSGVGQTFFIGLFGAEFRSEYGLSETALGTLYGLATLASGLAMFWLGAIADHLALRRAVLAALAVLIAGAGLVALSPAVAGLTAGLFLLRLGGQGLISHLAVVAAGRYAVRRRGRAVAMAAYGFILAEASFPALVAGGLGFLDWRGVWLAAAAALAGLAAPVLYFLARPLVGSGGEQEGATADPVTDTPRSRRKLFVHASFLRALSVVLVPPFLITALFLHQSSLAERLGWSLGDVAAGFVLFAAAQALAAFSTGRLVDRFSARALLRLELLPSALGVLAMGTLPPGAALWAMFAGLGVSAGMNSVISGAVWVELFGTARLGMIRGVYSALMVLSTAVGPVVLGGLFALEVSLLAMGIGFAAYALIAPLALVPGIRGGSVS